MSEDSLILEHQPMLYEINDDMTGLRFLAIWLFSGFVTVSIFFACVFLFDTSPAANHMVAISKDATLDAFVLKTSGDDIRELEKWQDILQHWSVYVPCTPNSRPINWEYTTVDLIVLSAKENSLEALYREYWKFTAERTRLCFRNLIFKNKTNSRLESGYYFVADLDTKPTKENWLNILNRVVGASCHIKTPMMISSRDNYGELEWRALYHHSIDPLEDTKVDNVTEYSLVSHSIYERKNLFLVHP